MPELPEVDTVVNALAPHLIGRTVASVKVHHAPSVEGSPAKLECLRRRKIEKVFRRGKFIRIDLDGGLAIAIHLRMTGWLGIQASDRRDPKEEPYVRVRFSLDDGAESLIFRDIRTFGRVWAGPLAKLEALKSLSRLGPEPLLIDAESFVERLRGRGGALKPLLLNQEFLAGIGNIYADETLFSAGLHPQALARNIRTESARRLHACIQRVLTSAIKAGGSSIDDFRHPDGNSGWFQRELLVYGREGEACRRCGGKIRRIVMGQRGTWFCANCQKRR